MNNPKPLQASIFEKDGNVQKISFSNIQIPTDDDIQTILSPIE